MRMSDRFLINKCLDGDPTAFGVLVDSYRESIYALAYSKLHNFHDAEDIAQEAFLKAYQNLRTLRKWDDFPAWLYAITNNLCKMWIRSKSKRPDIESIEEHGYLLEQYLDESQDENPMIDQIHEALASMPDMYQQVLTLHYLGGMSGREIASFLGASPTAIWQRIRRARAMLREEMLEMIRATFEQNRLRAGFTFRIIEMVKKIKINPMLDRTLPWGLSLTAGVIFTIMCLNPYIILHNPFSSPIYSPLPSEAKVLEIGELPVDILETSDVSFISSQKGIGNAAEPERLNPQDKPLSHIGNDKWSKISDMTTGRAIMSSGVIDGKIYVFGGIDQERTLTSVEEYDPVTGKWTRKADMPNIRYSLSVSEVDGKFYVIGGWRGDDGANFSMVEEYDPKTNKWTRKSDMPTPRSALSTSVINGKIYAIGGNGGDYLPAPTLSTVEEYDPKTDTWTRKADMPITRGSLCTAVVNGKIYAIGGVTGTAGGGYAVSSLVSVVDEYNPATDTWTKKSARIPTPRSMFSVSVVDGKIYAIGGENRNIDVNNFQNPCGISIVEEYDPINDVWTKKPDMPTRRCCLSTVSLNGKIYAIGGTDDLPFGKGFTTVEEYTPDTNNRDKFVHKE